MSWQWDKKQEKWIKEAADEEGILTSKAKEAIEFGMKEFVTEMRDKKPVNIPNVGRFFMSPYKTNKRILDYFKFWRMGLITREVLKEKVTLYWPDHVEARKHHPRTGLDYRTKRKIDELRRENGNEFKLQPLYKRREAERAEGPESVPEG